MYNPSIKNLSDYNAQKQLHTFINHENVGTGLLWNVLETNKFKV